MPESPHIGSSQPVWGPEEPFLNPNPTKEDAVPDGLIFFICGAIMTVPPAVWFGIRIGMERMK